MRNRTLCAIGAAIVLPLAAPGLAAAQEGDGRNSVEIQLDSLNSSGATGTATLTPTEDGGLQVQIDASGLVPNQPHAQHLHGGFDGTDFMCPGTGADTDGDGFVSTVEGIPAYGGIQLSLTTEGDTSADSGLALERFPTADGEGDLTYERTIDASALPEGTVEQLANLHIVQHGIDVDDDGQYTVQSPIGESPLAQSLGLTGVPAEATFPASCGMVSGAGAATMPEGGVATGDGSTTDTTAPALLAIGGVAALGAGSVLLVRRRAREEG